MAFNSLKSFPKMHLDENVRESGWRCPGPDGNIYIYLVDGALWQAREYDSIFSSTLLDLCGGKGVRTT